MQQQSQINSDSPRPLVRSEWRDEIRGRAESLGMELTREHWEVIEFVLDVYNHCMECRTARQMSNLLAEEFKGRGGRRYLYQLFPRGPVRQIHELVEMPELQYEVDTGFGTSF